MLPKTAPSKYGAGPDFEQTYVLENELMRMREYPIKKYDGNY